MDLAMEKMPVDIFEFYTLVEPYITGYYEIGETQHAQEIWKEVAAKYQEQLTYFSNVDEELQYKYYEEILTNIEKYRSLVDLLIINDDRELFEKEAKVFDNYMRTFPYLMGDDDEGEEVPQELLETLPEPSIEIPAQDSVKDEVLTDLN